MNTLTASLKGVLRQPAFVVVALILALAAAGLSGAVRYLQLNFRKLPVPLARPLVELPEKLGPWLQISIDEPLDADLEHTLGTDNYIFRDYVDTRLVSADEVAKFKDKLGLERRQALAELQMKNPRAVVNLSLTYYTGLVDTVAHVPDRCFVADGYEPKTYQLEQWTALQGLPGDGGVRDIVFEDQSPGKAKVARNVAYFFNCNGEFMNDPIAVRKRLAYLPEKYGYYMKVETHAIQLRSDEAAAVMNDLLKSAVPEIRKCLPDWEKVRSTASAPAVAALGKRPQS